MTRRRHSDDLHVEMKVAHHALQDDELLCILQSKDRRVRPARVEEHADDRRNAPEMPGPMGTAQLLVEFVDADPRQIPGRSRRIHLGVGRDE